MEPEAHPLQVMLSDSDYEPFAYSGRGMYGAKCLAVSTDDGIGTFITNILYGYRSIVEISMDDSAACAAANDIEHAMRGMKSDGMGLGTVYYWPRIEFVDRD